MAIRRSSIFQSSQSSTFDLNIFAINLDGSGLTNLSANGCSNDQLSISPDAAHIVFRRNCGPTDFDEKIGLMDVDGSNQRLLTTAAIVSDDPTGNKQRDPRFSPDREFVIFTSQVAAFGSRQVHRSTLDGATVVALTDVDTDGRFNDKPRYLPDGRIVFASGRAATEGPRFNDLYRINGDGDGACV